MRIFDIGNASWTSTKKILPTSLEISKAVYTATMAGKKRPYSDREFEVGELNDEEENVSVHGIVTELSPVKSGRKNERVKYFTGQLSDDKKSMRMVCFDPKLRQELVKSFEKTTPVVIKDCQVKKGYANSLEIVASSRRSKIEASDRDISKTVAAPVTTEICIEDICKITPMQLLTVNVKVLACRGDRRNKTYGENLSNKNV